MHFNFIDLVAAGIVPRFDTKSLQHLVHAQKFYTRDQALIKGFTLLATVLDRTKKPNENKNGQK
jgi:hypothetical protein